MHLLGVGLTLRTTPTFLTQHEVAEVLRLPERTLQDWRLAHAGPRSLKFGQHVRDDIADVLAWAKEKRRA